MHFSARPLAMLVLSALLACSTEPGRVDVRFVWGAGGPPSDPGATLFVRVSQLDGDGADLRGARVVAAASPVALAASSTLELPGVPNGDRLVVVVEVREANTPESTLLRYGVSPEFSLGAGETRVVEVEAAIRPPPSVSLSVAGTSSAGPELLVRAGALALVVASDTGVRAELSNFETFPSSSTRCVALVRPIAGCTDASDGRVSWDPQLGLADDCGVRAGTPRDRCPRRIYARIFDAVGLGSSLASIDVVQDARAPSVDGAELVYGVAPGEILERVTAARVGARVTVSFAGSEVLARQPPTLTALGPNGAQLELTRAAGGGIVSRYAVTVPEAALPDGDYALAPFELVDLAGNASTIDLGLTVRALFAPPTLHVRQEAVRHLRAPVKNLAADGLLPAGPSYFGVVPVDDDAPALAADTFTLGSTRATALRVYADLERRSLLLPRVDPSRDGTWTRAALRLPDLDPPRVYVSGLDASGNESAPVRVEYAWHLVSSGDASALDSSSDARVPAAPALPVDVADAAALDGRAVRRSPELAWRARGAPSAPGFAGFDAFAYDAARGQAVLVGFFGTLQTWIWDGYNFQGPSPTFPGGGDEALVYDRRRGRVVAIGSEHRTWEWDGASWTEVRTARAPSALYGGWSMAFDELRGVVVLFGGTDDGQLNDRTWIYDGVDWHDESPALSPPGRAYAAMTYDAARGEVLLFGGTRTADGGEALGDLWAWDGADWQPRSSPGGPSPRTTHNLVYDRGRGVALLHGGAPNQVGIGDYLRDTWEWDGARWREVSPAGGAPPFGDVVYDERLERALFWGGELEDQFAPGLARLRAWQDGRWAVIDPPVTPEFMLGMTYDSDRRRVVAINLGGTWEWDGAGWTRTTTVGPGPANNAAPMMLAYDAARRQTVYFSSRSLQDRSTWGYDGARWTLLSTEGPSPRRDHALAYDLARGRTVLFGGQPRTSASAPLLGHTWEWDGLRWTMTGTGAPARASHTLTYDAARGRTVLVGGHSDRVLGAGGAIRDVAAVGVMEWDGVAWSDRTPMGDPNPRFGGQETAYYDPLLGRVLIGAPGQPIWGWSGGDWLDLTPQNGVLPTPGAGPMTFDPRTGAGLVAFPALPSVGHTFSAEAIVPHLRLRAVPPAEVAMTSVVELRVRAWCGGTGGARLLGWAGAGWRTLASSGAGPDAPAMLELTATSTSMAALFMARDRRATVQCRAATDDVRSTVALDHAEVRIGYRTAE